MDLYAENFRREKIKSGKDLVYFGRVETERHYRNSDEEVKEGQAKSGDRSPGYSFMYISSCHGTM